MDRAYLQPGDLEAALVALAERPEAAVIAGGTDLVVGARSGKRQLPQSLIAIDRLPGLDAIEESPDGGLRIGALVTHSALEASPVVSGSWSALSDASALVGSPATRHLGTIGGNICNASPAMEVGGPLIVFKASVELMSKKGVRTVPFESFVTGPGKTARQPDELLTAIIIPALPTRGRTGSAYQRLEYRQAMEIAVVGAAAVVSIDAQKRCWARIALTAVAPTCVRAVAAEKLLAGKHLDEEGLLERVGAAATEAAAPIDDVRASAEYRRAMVPVIVRRALRIALDRALEQPSG